MPEILSLLLNVCPMPHAHEVIFGILTAGHTMKYLHLCRGVLHTRAFFTRTLQSTIPANRPSFKTRGNYVPLHYYHAIAPSPLIIDDGQIERRVLAILGSANHVINRVIILLFFFIAKELIEKGEKKKEETHRKMVRLAVRRKKRAELILRVNR
jgi:hypothetical protein